MGRLPEAADQPTFIYDIDCGFCTTSAMWLAQDGQFRPQAWQTVRDLSAIGLDERMVKSAAHWVVDGQLVASGSDAIGHGLISRGGAWRALGRFTINPVIRPFARFVYSLIAQNRHRMPGGTTECRI